MFVILFCLCCVLALLCDQFGRYRNFFKQNLFAKTKKLFLFSSSVVYYPLAQQSALQQPVYITPSNGATGTTWPSNLFSQFNLANLPTAQTSNTNVSTTINPSGTSTSQTVYEVSPALFDSSSATNGQQLYWPSYN
jgi:hypothetical protein